MDSEEKIKKLAYAIWEQEGRPEGKAVEHYLKAKKIIEKHQQLPPIELAPPAPRIELAPPVKIIELANPARFSHNGYLPQAD